MRNILHTYFNSDGFQAQDHYGIFSLKFKHFVRKEKIKLVVESEVRFELIIGVF